MPKENFEKPATQNRSPNELDDNKNAGESTGSKQSFLISIFEIFKHLFPAFKEAFAAGTKTFKRRVRGIPEPEPEPEPESEQRSQKHDRPGLGKADAEDEEESLPQQQTGFFNSKLIVFKQIINILNPFRKPVTSIPSPVQDSENEEIEETKTATGSKKRTFAMAFLIASIIILPTWYGLYLGGMFDEDGTAPQENSRQSSVFDSIFGQKSKKPATPKEKLAAMHITYNPNNFVKYAGQNDIPVVKLFIQSGMSPDTRRPIDGFTPLTAAAAFDRQEMTKFLVDDSGADINAQDNEGQTPLMKAVRHNRPQMVELLLGKNADYTIADKQGNTALSMAKELYGDNSLAKVFEKFGIDISAAKKEPAKNEQPEQFLLTTDSEAAPVKPKSTQYQEISVTEFLKYIQSIDNQ